MKKRKSVTPSACLKATSVTAAVLSALYGIPAHADDEDNGGITEVTVTATRRATTAQDIPLSITAVTGDQLQQAGIQDMAELAHSMAGVNYTDKGPFGGVNGATLIIRGLNSEATGGQLALATPIEPPVATYVDDTPLFVNLRLQDLDHVEILRGPQGTLYGSGSLGGTIRFVQNAPDPSGFDARAEVGASDTQHTHAPNEEVSGMINLPITSTFALRMNAGYENDAGFVNAPNLYRLDSSGAPIAAQPGNLLSPPETYSENGINGYDYKNARLSALWKPNDDFRAQLSYYYQLGTAGGFPQVAPLLGGVDNLETVDHTRASTDDKVNLVALTLDYDMGFATLTSNSSWAHHDNHTNSDLTNLYASFPFYPSLYGANPRVLVTGHDELSDRPWSEEIRLASKTGGFFDWVGGLYYKDQHTDIREHEFYPGYLDYFNACVPVYGVSNGDGVTPSQCGIGETVYNANPLTYVDGIPIVKDQAYIGDFETHFRDMAAFGELTAHLTSAWSVTGGTRVFKQTLSQAQQTGLLFDGPISIANNSLSDSWRRALWKINTSYQLNQSNLVYATWSQGFRRGSVNALPPSEPAVDYTTSPGLYKVTPDTANNYEVGVKGTIANHVRYSADVFDIQWHNVQEGAQLTPLVLPGAINVGNAYSRGVETEIFVAFDRHLSAQVDYTYDQTKLTSYNSLALDGLSVPPPAPGAPLPGTPKNSLAVTLTYGKIMIGPGEMRYSISAHYQSPVTPALSATIPIAPGYTMVDTRLSYQFSHYEITAYCNNLTNNLGINSYSDPFNYAQYYQAVISQPRTVGLTLVYSFKEH
jgi:iron complex outermembrane recepter protein